MPVARCCAAIPIQRDVLMLSYKPGFPFREMSLCCHTRWAAILTSHALQPGGHDIKHEESAQGDVVVWHLPVRILRDVSICGCSSPLTFMSAWLSRFGAPACVSRPLPALMCSTGSIRSLSCCPSRGLPSHRAALPLLGRARAMPRVFRRRLALWQPVRMGGVSAYICLYDIKLYRDKTFPLQDHRWRVVVDNLYLDHSDTATYHLQLLCGTV